MRNANAIRCLVVDDEPPAREILKRYIAEVPALQLAGECSNAVQVISFLQQHEADLLFLDINMPQVKGNELLKILKNPPQVIYTTAHAEYAVEGYELEITDYLLKPIQFDRFLKAVQKVFVSRGHVPVVKEAFPKPEKNVPFVYFRVERKMVKVLLEDILYIESMKDYVKVFTRDAMLVTKLSMMALEAMLPPDLFIRIHRSFIVSVSKIKSFSTELIDIGKMQLPLGRLYKTSVLKALEAPTGFMERG